MSTKTLTLPAPAVSVAIPFPTLDAAEIRKICGVSKKREFCQYPSLQKSVVRVVKTWPYKGSFKSWFKLENDARIESWATVESGRCVITQPHLGPSITLYPPKGMAFAVDKAGGHGLYVIRLSDGMDYHPTTADFRAPNFATVIRQKMAANYKARQDAARLAKQSAREAKIFAREVRSTRVTLADSRKAGNCVEGSLAFAERKLGLTREDVLNAGYLFSVSASRLLAVANGDKARVDAAIRVAYARETTISI